MRFSWAVAAAVFLMAGCSGSNPYAGLILPPTPVLSIQTFYGVVDYPLLRVRSDPVSDAGLVTMLRSGAIVEIVTSSSNEETIEGKTNRWFQIQYQGRRGWVFGSYIKVFDSLDKARNAAKAGPKSDPSTPQNSDKK